MNILQKYQKDLSFWTPIAKYANNDSLWASVVQVGGKTKISIPATSRAVHRDNGHAAYLRHPFYVEPQSASPPQFALPSILSVGGGAIVTITDSEYDASVNNIVINGYGTDKVNGVIGNYIINTNGASITLIANATTLNWEII